MRVFHVNRTLLCFAAVLSLLSGPGSHPVEFAR